MSQANLDELAANFKERYAPLVEAVKKAVDLDQSSRTIFQKAWAAIERPVTIPWMSSNIIQDDGNEVLSMYESLSSKSLDFGQIFYMPFGVKGQSSTEEILSRLQRKCNEQAARFEDNTSDPQHTEKMAIYAETAAACEVLIQEWAKDKTKNIDPLVQEIQAIEEKNPRGIKKIIEEKKASFTEQLKSAAGTSPGARAGRE